MFVFILTFFSEIIIGDIPDDTRVITLDVSQLGRIGGFWGTNFSLSYL